MRSLYLKAFGGLAVLFLIMASLLFVAAGTLHYWQGWLFLAIYFLASLAITLYLINNNRALLARRMSGGPFAEKEPAQRIIMALVSMGFVGLILLPAIDHRFGWSHLSIPAVLAGNALVLLGWLGIFFVFRENSFASATIESTEDQRVISTGLYAWVRHPMYATLLLMLLGMPVALGSWWGVLVVIAIVPALIWRLTDEERFLVNHLPDYSEYQRRVRYRVLPRVW